jgi:hypothetical protein
MNKWNIWIICAVLCCAGPASLFAQLSSRAKPKPGGPYLAAQKKYTSAIQIEAENLVSRTKPGYYSALLDPAKTKEIQNKQTALRTHAPCGDSYLCNLDPLPVTLISVKGERLSDSQVRLFWETSSETDNLGFQVERSVQGAGNFETVGTIDGAGNSVHSKKYDMIDFNSHPETSYYRLKQLDFDGKFTYSRVIAVKGINQAFKLAVVPNPATGNDFSIRIEGRQTTGEVELIVYNAKGVAVYRNRQIKLNTAKQIPIGEIPSISTGLYQAKVVSRDGEATVMFAVVK